MRPKHIAALVLTASVTLLLCLEGQSPQERLKKKLAGAWVKNAAWITDLDEAKASATKSGKQIFAYFTRSYAP